MKLNQLFIFFVLLVSPTDKIATSYINVSVELCKKNDYTIVYLWKPWCKPCVDNLNYLSRLNKNNKCSVVLLTTENENVAIASKYGFKNSYYFDKSTYKTHTKNYDEYDQFTKEVFKMQGIKEPNDRAIYPATFVFNQSGKLIYYNKKLVTEIDSLSIDKIIQ